MSKTKFEASAVFDAVDLGLMVLNGEGEIEHWNAWLASASGVAACAARGRALTDVFPGIESPRRIGPAVRAAIESGRSSFLTHSLVPTIFPLRTRAGRVMLHDVVVATIGSRQKPECLIQIFDVTMPAERERVLRLRQNARYDAILESAPDAILTFDESGSIQLANPAAQHQFGYTSQELIGQPAFLLFADESAWSDHWSKLMRGEPPLQPVEIMARRRDGSPSYLEVSAARWQSESHTFMTAILRDINSRRVAEEALRSSEAKFRSFAQAVPNHVWTALPDGTLDWFNDRVFAYSGHSPDEFDWTSMVHPDDLALTLERWRAALQSGKRYETEFRLRRGDGLYRWHIARAVPTTGPGGEIVQWLGTNTDIEDQKAAARALADLNATLEGRVEERTSQLMQAEDALRQSQKMDALGQLTGGIAHDFNNLLQAIIGGLERVQKRLAEGRIGDVDRFLNGALESANRAAALTHRLLAFSRRQPVDPRPIDVNHLIATTEELLRRSIGETIEMRLIDGPGIWVVRCDSSQLENALLNLAINARDAMPDGGVLTIETSNVVLDAVQALRCDVAPGDYVSIRISDTGVGMPANIKSHAFDPFFTTKPIGKGTGLGLSMIYGFVRQSDGSVQIHSEVGRGTTIEIFLPRFVGLSEQPEQYNDEPVIQRRADEDEVVLVVEDESVVRLLIVDILSDLGYRALEAADGPSALRILQSSQRIDLLVTDMGLPGLNGRQIADAGRTNRPTLKVLFMTGYAEKVAGKSFLEPGMELIIKPFTMDLLAKQIRTMIKRA